MCKWKSAVVDRTGKLHHHWCTDRHEDIVAIFGLRDSMDHICRVELLPGDDPADINGYTLNVEERERPTWWTPELAERTETALREIVKNSIINDVRSVLVPGSYVLGENAKIGRVINCGRIVRAGSAQIEYAGSAQIEHAQNAQIKYAGSAQIEYAENAQIEYAENAQIKHAQSAQIEHAQNAQIGDQKGTA